MEKCSRCKKPYYTYAYSIPPVCPSCKKTEIDRANEDDHKKTKHKKEERRELLRQNLED